MGVGLDQRTDKFQQYIPPNVVTSSEEAPPPAIEVGPMETAPNAMYLPAGRFVVVSTGANDVNINTGTEYYEVTSWPP